jgi:Kef-type K+ transport system membrane component KefB
MSTVGLLMLQVATILCAAQTMSRVMRWCHQPAVIGEMAAGIMLGPSLLGSLAPVIWQRLFPEGSLPGLNAVSQVGVVLYMFAVGLRLQAERLRGHAHIAVMTSHASIVAPFACGAILAMSLYPRFAGREISAVVFGGFVGVCMSITAFPVLSRILVERQMAETKLGTLAIACAAVDDATGWCLLAIVLLLRRTNGGAGPLALMLASVALFLFTMFRLVRPLLRRLYGPPMMDGNDTARLASMVAVGLLCAAATDYIGLHVVFGAFLAGAIMPRQHGVGAATLEKLDASATIVFMPVYFATTGLRTSVGSIGGVDGWAIALAIIAVAALGKVGGTFVAATLTGTSWREATALGILLNTRGLMELVVLNLGLDLHILSEALFSMMVLMTLTTTSMTAPLLELLDTSASPFWVVGQRRINESQL